MAQQNNDPARDRSRSASAQVTTKDASGQSSAPANNASSHRDRNDKTTRTVQSGEVNPSESEGQPPMSTPHPLRTGHEVGPDADRGNGRDVTKNASKSGRSSGASSDTPSIPGSVRPSHGTAGASGDAASPMPASVSDTPAGDTGVANTPA
jgi:hypothetical protein